MLELDRTTVPVTLAALWDRLVRLFLSMPDSKYFLSYPVKSGAEGTLLRHECKAQPKSATAQVRGSAASSAVVTVGAITGTFITLYTTADCTVDVEVKL